MVMILLASAAGAPGVTTTALGLVLAWPRPALLADADRDASQAVLAGYLGGADAQRRGLVALAQAQREGRPLDVVGQCLPLPPQHRQAFLPGFSAPGQVGLFGAVWPALAHALAAVAAGTRDVVVDAGRIGPHGLPAPMVRAADLVLLVTGSSLRALAASRHHVSGLREASGGREEAVGIAMVGAGRPYGLREVEGQFGIPVVIDLPWEPKEAAELSDGGRHRPGALAKAYGKGADTLLRTLDARRAQVRGAA